MNKKPLLDRLAADLRPTHRFSAGVVVMLWLALSWAFVIGVTLATGDLRPGVFEQLQDTPRFVLECLLGFGIGIFTFRTALLLAIPGRVRPERGVTAVIGLLALWIGVYAYGLVDPALQPSRIGYRAHCFTETFLYSSVPIIVGFWLVARRTAISRAWAGALVGAAATSLPALFMQIACMYEPMHTLKFHLVPVVVMGIVGAILGRALFRAP